MAEEPRWVVGGQAPIGEIMSWATAANGLRHWIPPGPVRELLRFTFELVAHFAYDGFESTNAQMLLMSLHAEMWEHGLTHRDPDHPCEPAPTLLNPDG